MGIIERFGAMLARGESGRIDGQVHGRDTTFITYLRPAGDVEDVSGFTVERLWATQPHLRTVVDFIASTVAGLGMHVFDRDQGEDDRTRVRSGPLAGLLRSPNSEQTGDELIYSIAHEISIYDDCYLFVAQGRDGEWNARVVPTPWVTLELADKARVTGYIVNGTRVPLQSIVRFPGWTPGDPTASTSKVQTLRTILASEHASHAKRRNILTKGPRVGGVIQRPKDAPVWSDAARRTFDETWSAFQPGGERAGDAVMLEDGMTYVEPSFDASAQGYIDGSQLSLSTVAQVYQLHPSIVGVPGAAGYSSVREYNRSLISNSLAWLLRRIQARFTTVLGPLVGEPDGHYVEFNVESRLRGSFEEQAAVIRQAVGAPYMTRNEARARFNLPRHDDADALIVPLNTTVEGESNRSPEDDAAQADGIRDEQAAGGA